MNTHRASIHWQRTSQDFAYDSYNRAHEIAFKDGQIRLAASAAPAFKGDAERIDPEEIFVASLSSCHMLSFLAICARRRIVVDNYDDAAEGYLEKGAGGKFWISRVTLRPRVHFSTEVSQSVLAELHRHAHEECLIANSVKTTVAVEAQA